MTFHGWYQMASVHGLSVPNRVQLVSDDHRLKVIISRESGTDTPLYMYDSKDKDVDAQYKRCPTLLTLPQAILAAMEFLGVWGDVVMTEDNQTTTAIKP